MIKEKKFIFLFALSLALLINFNCSLFTDLTETDFKEKNILPYYAAGLYDETFNNGGFGSSSYIRVIDAQSDGKILIGGEFFAYNNDINVPDRIIRLNTNGTFDDTFNNGGTGANDYVLDIKILPDGKIIIGGGFTAYNGDSIPHNIARLNSNGTIDSTFNNGGTGTGTNEMIYDIEVLSNGKILIGGLIDNYNGSDVPDGIIRLNSNGSIDSTFNNGGTGANGYISSLSVQSDGKIIITGSFTTYNGVGVPHYIARLNADGTFDNTFNNGGFGSDMLVESSAIQPDGRILIGGNTSSYNGIDVPKWIMRLNTDGSIDTSFNNGGSGADGRIFSIAVQSDGKILIAGEFTLYNGLDVPNQIMRLNNNGTFDESFNTGGSGSNGIIYEILLQSNGKILIAGNITTYNSINVPDGIIRLK